MFDPCRLLSYEFFPVELPPCFQSVSLANKYQQFIATASSITTPSIPLTYSGYNFAYNVSEGYSGGLKFVTQRELSRIITKLQKMLSDRIKSVNSSVENGNKLTDRESKLFEEYVHMFEETERIY